MNLIDHKLNGPNAQLPAHWTQGGWTPEGMKQRIQALMVRTPDEQAERLRKAYAARRTA